MAGTSKVLVGYDGSAGAETMLDDLRRAGLPESGEFLVLSAGEGTDLAQRAAARITADFPTWGVRADAVSGSAARALLDVANSWRPDLLVVGSHGRSAAGRLLRGSVSHTLLAEAHCSVRVARRGGSASGSGIRILVGADGSPNAMAAVEAVASRRWPPNSEARVVHAIWREPEPRPEDVDRHEHAALQEAERAAWEERRAKEIVEAASERLHETGLVTSTLTSRESAKRLLVEDAEKWRADCIFVGATGLNRLDRLLLGSTATALVTNAGCTVEVVRAPEPA
jgi:nucleotide-binding universal stress UspA family protein